MVARVIPLGAIDGGLRDGDFGNESIAVPGYGFDVLRRMEQFPQLRNAIVQVVIFDDRVRPYRLHERIFAHELSGILHQHAKSVEEFAPQADLLVTTKQPSLIHVEEVIAKEIFGHCQIAAGVGGRSGKPQVPRMAAILPAKWGASSLITPTSDDLPVLIKIAPMSVFAYRSPQARCTANAACGER